MYNEEQKQRYINWAKDNYYEQPSIDLLKRIFTSTEYEETVFNKDVSEFNSDEVYDLLSTSNSKSRRKLQSDCIYLNNYYMWCKEENLVISFDNPFDKRFVEAFIDKIIPKEQLNDKYFSRERFEEYKNSVIDSTNKFLMECFFNGISGEDYSDISNLKMSDLDFDKKEVQLKSGRIIKVDREFINLMIQANDETQYFKDGVEKESKSNIYDYVESIYVFKPCGTNYKTPYASRSVIISKLKTIKQQTGNNFISAPCLYKNGMINYIKNRYAEREIDFKMALMDTSNDRESQSYIEEYGATINIRMLRMEIKDYLDQL